MKGCMDKWMARQTDRWRWMDQLIALWFGLIRTLYYIHTRAVRPHRRASLSGWEVRKRLPGEVSANIS